VIDGRPLTEVAATLWYLARRYPDAGLLPQQGDIEAEARSRREKRRNSKPSVLKPPRPCTACWQAAESSRLIVLHAPCMPEDGC